MPCGAVAITDQPNDFIPSFEGPHKGDLDVLSTDVSFNGGDFTFTVTINGDVGETPGARFVWVYRGMGTAQFASICATDVLFDSVVALSIGTSSVKDLISGKMTLITNTTIIGSTISGVVPVPIFLRKGSRLIAIPTISGLRLVAAFPVSFPIFAPDNANVVVTATPEPSTMSLFSIAALGAFFLLCRSKSS